MRLHRSELAVILFLVLGLLFVFWQVQDHDFVNYDDNLYVTQNRHVQAGLTGEGVIWAFTSMHASNWHPLTWLSHMLDCEIYGLDPKGHHVTNLLLHAANTALLFLVLRWMTGALWRPACVAALFALHPLHVESVAWVAERKDVLSTFFWILTMFAYTWYVKGSSHGRYLLVLLAFALGLMAKSMLVTLPFVLLLLDYWPLRRLSMSVSATNDNRIGLWNVIREKLPLLTLTAGSCLVTFLAQRIGPAVQSLSQISLQARISNALVSYVKYIGKMIWPSRLAIFYPHPLNSLPVWQIAGATLLLLCITILILQKTGRYPYLTVGWLWFLGTLVPVVGIVQVGGQAMADRYTYVPLIGLFICITWAISSLVAEWSHQKVVVSILVVVAFSALATRTWFQLRHWENSIALSKHALDVTANNYLAHNNLGVELVGQRKYEEAIDHYYEALRIQPGYAEAHNNLGVALAYSGRLQEAIEHIFTALRIRPEYADAHQNLRRLMRVNKPKVSTTFKE